MNLREYQAEAVAAVYDHLRTRDDNPGVVIPTGGGKTPVIATICSDAVRRWNGRVLVLAHVRELLEQSVAKIAAIDPGLRAGVYSAGLRRRELDRPVTVAGIQSVYQRAFDLGRVDLVIVDEAHLIPPDGEGMYRRFIQDARQVNPHVRVIGLTATPYRMRSGPIATPDGIINHVCYEVGVADLIADGYLCKMRSKAGLARANTDGVSMRGGEFVSGELEAACNTSDLVASAVAEIVSYTTERRSTLVFCAGVAHGQHVVDEFRTAHGIECGWVDGETPAAERDATLARFKSGALRYLANVNVLTTGFDAPNVDCVALMRPTMSPGLYYQMVGRGFRLSDGKADCLVLDFGQNIVRHGPVDLLKGGRPSSGSTGDAPAKECPQCHAVVPAGVRECLDCGYAFPLAERAPGHDATASAYDVIGGTPLIRKLDVERVSYAVHRKRSDPTAAPTLRVDYRIGDLETVSEWVCIEHPEGSFARSRARAWWERRSLEPFPKSVERALALAAAGCVAEATRITVKTTPGERFDRVTHVDLEAIPARLDGCSDPDEDAPLLTPDEIARIQIMADEIPF